MLVPTWPNTKWAICQQIYVGANLFDSHQDFVNCIEKNFKPIRNRVLKAELMEGSLDMKKYLAQYHVEIAGLVHTHHDSADANHCWRFIRRSDALLYLLLQVFPIAMNNYHDIIYI